VIHDRKQRNNRNPNHNRNPDSKEKNEKEQVIKNRLRRVRMGWSNPAAPKAGSAMYGAPTPPRTGKARGAQTARGGIGGTTPRGKSSQGVRAVTTGQRPRGNGGSKTARNVLDDDEGYGDKYQGMDPCKLALSNIGEAEIGAILALKRPPGLVRKVFTALMLLVSPFETSELDVTWDAVKDWVSQVGGVREWLHNLWNFNLAVVPISNAIKTLGYLEAERLDKDTLEKFSLPLSKLGEYIRIVCHSAHERPVTREVGSAKKATPRPPTKSREKASGGSNRSGLDGLDAPEDAETQAMRDEIHGSNRSHSPS